MIEEVGRLRIDFGSKKVAEGERHDVVLLFLSLRCLFSMEAKVAPTKRKGKISIELTSNNNSMVRFVMTGTYGSKDVTVTLPSNKSGFDIGPLLDDIRDDSWREKGERVEKAELALVALTAVSSAKAKSSKSRTEDLPPPPKLIVKKLEGFVPPSPINPTPSVDIIEQMVTPVPQAKLIPSTPSVSLIEQMVTAISPTPSVGIIAEQIETPLLSCSELSTNAREALSLIVSVVDRVTLFLRRGYIAELRARASRELRGNDANVIMRAIKELVEAGCVEQRLGSRGLWILERAFRLHEELTNTRVSASAKVVSVTEPTPIALSKPDFVGEAIEPEIVLTHYQQELLFILIEAADDASLIVSKRNCKLLLYACSDGLGQSIAANLEKLEDKGLVEKQEDESIHLLRSKDDLKKLLTETIEKKVRK